MERNGGRREGKGWSGVEGGREEEAKEAGRKTGKAAESQ